MRWEYPISLENEFSTLVVLRPCASRQLRRRPQTQPDSSTPIFHLVLSIHHRTQAIFDVTAYANTSN